MAHAPHRPRLCDAQIQRRPRLVESPVAVFLPTDCVAADQRPWMV